MGNRDQQKKKPTFGVEAVQQADGSVTVAAKDLLADRVSVRAEDVVDDEDDDSFDDSFEEVDDRDTLRLERERMEPADGRRWTEVATTLESITYATEVRMGGTDMAVRGCILRTKSWGLGGEPSQCVTWLPGVMLEELLDDDDDTRPAPKDGT